MPPADTPSSPAPKLLDQVRDRIRVKHYSIRTETQYVQWIRRFILFHGKRHPRDLSTQEVEAFLTHLAVEGNVAAATQNQALSALLFLYREVLGIELPWLDKVTRAKRPRHLPVVLTRDEVRAVLGKMEGVYGLLARLLYGTGMRLMEVIRLRVKDVEFTRGEIVVRDGKGAKDRVTMLPESVKADLQAHLAWRRDLFERDLRQARPRFTCRMHWHASIRTRRRSGAGSMCFRRAAIRSTRAAARNAGIISTKSCCSAR